MAIENPDEYLDVRFEDITARLTRTNTSLYTFWGSNAMFSHVYVDFPEDEIPDSGPDGAEFRVFANEYGYQLIVDYIQVHKWPQYLNLNDVPETDVEAFYDKQLLYLADSFGEGSGGEIA